ncbi:MAG TPA: class I SAM-dependent methyltransferase [Candidatus Binataceae bacterium]|nr:class I SAM-dependent methyltransferase [Candidatus Binataceae bacterium]
MATYDAPTYGERIADVYDQYPTTPGNADQVVEVLAALAGKRRVLELGIGTGRIALPLAARGFKVSGIDASPKMVEKLREKPGGDAIPVAIGNFADVKVPGQFSLIYVVFNTFFALLSQEEQLRCFAGIARHLTDDGAFVMEAFVPDVTRYDRGQRTSTIRLDTEHAYIDSTMHDPVNQHIRGAHIILGEDGTRFYPLELRYAWPAELDLMAQIAGMRLRDRWGGWSREPFTASSERHVSIYEKVLPLPPIPAAKPARRKRR